jgi:phospholipase D1/2
MPSDLEKRGKDAKERLRSVLGHEDPEDLEKKKKAQLRAWAEEANHAQELRLGRPLQRSDTLEEKAMLASVPEDEKLHMPDFGGDTSRQSTPSDNGTSNTITNSNDATSPTVSSATAVNNPLSEKTVAFPQFSSVGPTNSHTPSMAGSASVSGGGTMKKRRRGTTRGSRKDFSAADDILSIDEAEELLGMVQGTLVAWPYDW